MASRGRTSRRLPIVFALVVLVFYLYRTLRGFIHALDGRPY